MKAVTRATIDDAVPHIYTRQQADKIIAGYPEHERDARARGKPALGSGLVFPVPEELIKCEPFQPPPYFRRLIGIDFGINHPFAAVKIAYDAENDVIYIGREYRKKDASTATHAAVLRQMGGNVVPIAWPHDGEQRNPDDKDTRSKAAIMRDDYGLYMLPTHATHPDGGYATEPGIMDMLTRMQEGRLKVFSTCQAWFEEFSTYHRKDGVIVKLVDDLMSATRIAVMAKRFAEEDIDAFKEWERENGYGVSDEGRSGVTGY